MRKFTLSLVAVWCAIASPAMALDVFKDPLNSSVWYVTGLQPRQSLEIEYTDADKQIKGTVDFCSFIRVRNSPETPTATTVLATNSTNTFGEQSEPGYRRTIATYSCVSEAGRMMSKIDGNLEETSKSAADSGNSTNPALFKVILPNGDLLIPAYNRINPGQKANIFFKSVPHKQSHAANTCGYLKFTNKGQHPTGFERPYAAGDGNREKFVIAGNSYNFYNLPAKNPPRCVNGITYFPAQ